MACLRVAPLVMVAALLALAGSAVSTKYKLLWCNSLTCSPSPAGGICYTIQIPNVNICTAPGMGGTVPPGVMVTPYNQTFVVLKTFSTNVCTGPTFSEAVMLSDNGMYACELVAVGGTQTSALIQTGFARALVASPLTLTLASLLALLAMALMT